MKHTLLLSAFLYCIISFAQQSEKAPCSQMNTRNNLDNTIAISSPSQLIATDLEVSADEMLTLTTIIANLDAVENDGGIAAATINIYDTDGSGRPGSIIASEFDLVPTSQVFLESTDFGTDLFEMTFDLITPIVLSGGSEGEKYWVQMAAIANTSGNYVGWENTTENIVGSGFAINIGGVWAVVGTNDMIYTFSGECEVLSIQENVMNEENTYVLPNPVENVAQLIIPQNFDKKNTTVSIRDIQGKIVLDYIFRTGEINMNGLESGIYFISVSEGDRTVITKMVKK